jgi:hypothetical protein
VSFRRSYRSKQILARRVGRWHRCASRGSKVVFATEFDEEIVTRRQDRIQGRPSTGSGQDSATSPLRITANAAAGMAADHSSGSAV